MVARETGAAPPQRPPAAPAVAAPAWVRAEDIDVKVQFRPPPHSFDMRHIQHTPLLPAAVIQPALRQHRADKRARQADGDLHFELTGSEALAAYQLQEQQKQAQRDLAEAKRQQRQLRKGMSAEEKKAERTAKAAARRQAKRQLQAGGRGDNDNGGAEKKRKKRTIDDADDASVAADQKREGKEDEKNSNGDSLGMGPDSSDDDETLGGFVDHDEESSTDEEQDEGESFDDWQARRLAVHQQNRRDRIDDHGEAAEEGRQLQRRS